MSISENLHNLGALMKTNLEKKGVTGLTGNEGLTTLANKILDIECNSSSSKSVVATVTGNSITLGIGSNQWLLTTGDVIVDWGDGTTDRVNNPTTSLTHNYTDNLTTHTVIFGGEVTGIGEGCFYNCDGLTSITIPNTVTSLGFTCFAGCTGLTSITIPSSVTSIGDNCFQSCTGLTSVTISNSVTSLPYACFTECTGLTSITIPSSVTSLGEYCFSGCAGLTSVTIPNTVTSIGNYCFYDCTSLIDYELYWMSNPVTYDSSKMPVNTNTVFTIPTGTTSIYNNAGYPVANLVERGETLTLTCDKPIIQKTETSTVTATLKQSGSPLTGKTLNYQVKHGNTVISSGTKTTNNSGQATISYTGTGVGDIEVIVSYGTLLQETFVIEDCFKYDTTVHTRTTTSSSDLLTPIYNDYSFVSDNFCAEFVWQGNGEGSGVGIAPKGRTTPYHHLLNACGTAQISTYLGNEISGETSARWGSFQNNVDYRFKIEYMNGTVKFYINDELKITYSDKTYLNGETRDLYFLEWNRNLNIQVKDIKIKAL